MERARQLRHLCIVIWLCWGSIASSQTLPEWTFEVKLLSLTDQSRKDLGLIGVTTSTADLRSFPKCDRVRVREETKEALAQEELLVTVCASSGADRFERNTQFLFQRGEIPDTPTTSVTVPELAWGKVSLAQFAPNTGGELPADTEFSFRPVESPGNFSNFDFVLRSRRSMGEALIEHVWTDRVNLKLNENYILYPKVHAKLLHGRFPVPDGRKEFMLISIRVFRQGSPAIWSEDVTQRVRINFGRALGASLWL